jgi:hypothetical protein
MASPKLEIPSIDWMEKMSQAFLSELEHRLRGRMRKDTEPLIEKIAKEMVVKLNVRLVEIHKPFGEAEVMLVIDGVKQEKE